MLVVVTCPKCQKQSNVPESNIGKRVRCSGCQAIVLVSAPDADLPPVPPPPPRRGAPPPLPQQYDAGETFEEPAAEATPAPTRAAAPPSRFGYWIAVIAVGLLMVAGGIFAAVYFKK